MTLLNLMFLVFSTFYYNNYSFSELSGVLIYVNPYTGKVIAVFLSKMNAYLKDGFFGSFPNYWIYSHVNHYDLI